jgi:hypothetical protein
MCALRNTIKFQKFSSRYITGGNISRTTKGITNAEIVSKVIVTIM